MMTCEQHDYIELACIYLYQVKIGLKSGEQVQGQALDTLFNDQREACLCLKQDEELQMVVLDQIATMTACQKNPHFQTVSFV